MTPRDEWHLQLLYTRFRSCSHAPKRQHLDLDPTPVRFCSPLSLSLSQAKEDAEAEDRRKRGLAAAGHCDACGKILVAKKAFSRFEFRYCSSDCANLHKRKLAADAAERRFNGGSG